MKCTSVIGVRITIKCILSDSDRRGVGNIAFYFRQINVVLYLVEFIMIVNASISVPVEDTSQGNVEFACNALGEYQRELYGPQVQVRRAVLDIIVIDFGIGSNDNCIRRL